MRLTDLEPTARTTTPVRFPTQGRWTAARLRDRVAAMLRALRLAVQFVLFFLLLSAVIGVSSSETGVVEKGALIVYGGVLVWLASRVRGLGARPTTPRQPGTRTQEVLKRDNRTRI